MSNLFVSPEDRRWMMRRTSTTIRLGLALLLFSCLMHTDRSIPMHGQPVVLIAASVPAAPIRPGDAARPVPPVGWRKTSQGWERAEDWARRYPEMYVQPRSLQEWIDWQREAEPAWTRNLFGALRRIPPLGFAGLQVIAIWLIARQGPTATRATADRIANRPPETLP